MATLITLLVLKRAHGTDRFPPVRSGWLPWLGCALEFGREPLNFINRTKDELGHVFTIHAAGKYMTFITSPAHYDHFFHTAHADFQKAVQPFTNRAAGVSKSSFFTHHTSMHDLIKGNFVPAHLHASCEQLSKKLYGRMVGMVTDSNGIKVELLTLVKSIMFPAVVSHLFGDDILPEGKEPLLHFQQSFFKFDEDFEYGAELPEMFLRDWSQQKHWLLRLFQQLLRKRGGADANVSDQSVFNKIIASVDKENAPNYALLLLWASQANATPVVFWTLCFILSCPSLHEQLSQELASVLPPVTQLDHTPITYHMIQQLPMVKRCVLEAVRLRSPGMITRKVTKTHKLEDYTIPEGHYLMMSPYWAHRDPQLFPSPDAFDPVTVVAIYLLIMFIVGSLEIM